MLFSALVENTQGILTDTMALAAVTLIGYLFGHRTRKKQTAPAEEKLGIEISRAARIAKELNQVAQSIRLDISTHQSKITQFKDRVGDLRQQESNDGWQLLSQEAETLLAPTAKLASNLTLAYDQLRKQSSRLMHFAETRTDPITGVCNRLAMEEQLDVLFSEFSENGSRFSLLKLSMGNLATDHAKADQSDDRIRHFAELLENWSRDTDLVARCNSDEFVILMPHTSLAGAAVYCERLLNKIESVLTEKISGGIVEIQACDTPAKILSRADSALYSARTNSSSCLYLHNGKTIRPSSSLSKSAQPLGTTDLQSGPTQSELAIVGS